MTITLSKAEETAYLAIKTHIETNGNLKCLARYLSLSIKTVQRYIKGFLQFGRDWFAHGNRGKACAHRVNDNTREKISALFSSKYQGATFAHFTELLKSNENVFLSETFVRTYLTNQFLLSPKTTRKTRKAIRQKFAQLKQQPKLNLHPTRPRLKYFGELVQTDASTHPWFGTQHDKATLHIAVDDATSRVVGAYFDKQ